MVNKKNPASNIEWKMCGEYDPLWSVAAWNGKKKNGENPWSDKEFYKLGESDWEDFSAYWERFGVNRSSVLEIGCGAGRITKQLSKYFQEVHAVDVSEGMIAYARGACNSHSITFYVSDGVRIPLPDNSITAVFSCHVFQHFDSILHATRYFEEIFRVLQTGGSMMIHLPIYSWPCGVGKSIPLLYRLKKAVGYVRACIKRTLVRQFRLRPFMRMTSYPVEYFFKTLGELGFTNIAIFIFPTKSNDDAHHFVFARK